MTSASVKIHPTAIIEDGAEIDTGVTIGPYAIIGKHVRIAKNTQIHAHSLITGHTHIGEENQIYSYASVGNTPQDLKYKGEPTQLIIGDRNIIREFTTLQPGTVQGGGKTTIGNENLFMAYTHIAHDCFVGNQNILANGTQLAGHVTIHNMTVIGGLSAVHQFVHIGDMAMLAGGTLAHKDIPPYCMSEGRFNSLALRGLNFEGLRRRNISLDTRNALKEAYKRIFLKSTITIDDVFNSISHLMHIPEIDNFVNFIKNSKRGVAVARDSIKKESETQE
ncbi:acyl-ACP--UDP-N-acetylglucosamine O-acyltransferase [Spirobacillus cienkowskii]|jgi:UDP-N-acetylglucosamine acyltransferase|uniref:Acyl-[acyl-carrier-protein]--UDP-N-acetylglucosamine O-acyltransferase n=1 Tax=Spirobacillus cienkowskii TaxID=495820 RepID=A0A369KQX8_9BACT|nr:MAG: acyl-ACP--UDP-N-acetylglucosamine O-acyltransferase [Spirobacillus cienkowskii]